MADEENPFGDRDDAGSGGEDSERIVFEDRSETETVVAACNITGDTAEGIGVAAATAMGDSAEPDVEDFLVGPDRMMEQVKTALQNVKTGKCPLQVPNFSTEDSLRSFIRLLNQDEWLKYNAVIISCSGSNGCGTFGISRVEDGDFWQGSRGSKALGGGQIKVYSISEFTEMAIASWQEGIDGAGEVGPN